MDFPTIARLCIPIALFCAASYLSSASRRRGLRLPPGPAGSPIIGHAALIPSEDPHVAYHEWAKKYGDVIYLTCFGRPLIVLDSLDAATDLLEKRSSIYSNRPCMEFYSLMGFEPNLAFMPYGQRFRTHRRLIQPFLSSKACAKFGTVQLQNAHLLISGLMENKGNREYLLSRYTTAVVMRIAYGHQIVSDDDEYIRIANNSIKAVHSCAKPGATPVDMFPFLRYLPSWFPGTYYANVARKWRWAVDELYNFPYDVVYQQVLNGTAKPCFVSSQLEAAFSSGRHLTKEEADDIKSVAAATYSAGAETTCVGPNPYISPIHPYIALTSHDRTYV